MMDVNSDYSYSQLSDIKLFVNVIHEFIGRM